jgi:hypothetical protein
VSQLQRDRDLQKKLRGRGSGFSKSKPQRMHDDGVSWKSFLEEEDAEKKQNAREMAKTSRRGSK